MARPLTSALTVVAALMLSACVSAGAGDTAGSDPDVTTNTAGPAATVTTSAAGPVAVTTTTTTTTTTGATSNEITSSTAASGTGGGNGGGGGGGGGGGDGGEGFDYVPWGPGDPPIPQQYLFLAASSDRQPRCGDLANEPSRGDFWAIALAVCRAITGAGEWPATISVPPPPPADDDYQRCLDEELLAMLRRALDWHADHPGSQPEVSYPAASSRSPCQFQIYRLQANEPDEDQAGSIPVAVTATGLGDDDLVVSVDGIEVEPDPDDPDDGLETVVVLVPAATAARRVTIEIRTVFGARRAEIDLPAVGETPETTETSEVDESDRPTGETTVPADGGATPATATSS